MLLGMTNSLNVQAFLQEFHHSHKGMFILVNPPAFCDLAPLFLSLFILRHTSVWPGGFLARTVFVPLDPFLARVLSYMP